MGRLSGKTAIITGGSRGIGAACAEVFAREGAQVAIFDLNIERGESVAAKIGARFYRCDVTRAEAVDAAVEATRQDLGLPNVLVNNAGISIPQGLEEMSEADWDRTFAVNVKSVYLLSRRVIPLMRQAGGGSIINMASESAFIGFPMHPAYCSSKAAVMHLSKSMATRYAPEKIRVNALCPGTIETELLQEFFAKLPNPAEARGEIEKMHPLGIGTPEDIAWAAVYLASDESRYTTGSAMLVDGGSTAI